MDGDHVLIDILAETNTGVEALGSGIQVRLADPAKALQRLRSQRKAEIMTNIIPSTPRTSIGRRSFLIQGAVLTASAILAQAGFATATGAPKTSTSGNGKMTSVTFDNNGIKMAGSSTIRRPSTKLQSIRPLSASIPAVA